MFCVRFRAVGLGSSNPVQPQMSARTVPAVTRVVSVAACLCCIAACARAQEVGSEALPSREARRVAAFQLEEVARTREDSLFSNVTGIDVDAQGRIYVGDWQAARVAVLSPDGRLLRTMGRKGLGPGEFRSIRGLQVLPGDSLLVYDPNAARLTVFSPSGEAAYGLNLGDTPGGPPFLIWRAPGSAAYVTLSRPPFTDRDAEPRLDQVRLLDLRGRPRGGVVQQFPSRSFVRVQQSGGFSVMPNPFGFEGFVAIGTGAVYVAASDSLAVAAYGPEGQRRSAFSYPYEPPRVERADVDAALAGLPEWAAGRYRLALADSAPDRWPPVRGLLADDAGRVWLLLSSSTGQPREWAAFGGDGHYAGSIFVPDDVNVMAVRGGRVYAVSADGTQVVVYSVGERR
jgi:hypothetical protein